MGGIYLAFMTVTVICLALGYARQFQLPESEATPGDVVDVERHDVGLGDDAA